MYKSLCLWIYICRVTNLKKKLCGKGNCQMISNEWISSTVISLLFMIAKAFCLCFHYNRTMQTFRKCVTSSFLSSRGMTVNFIWQSYLHLLCLPKNAHGSGELSEYEKKRLENIRQNSEFFDGLQLTEVMTLLLCHFAFAYTHIFIYIYMK